MSGLVLAALLALAGQAPSAIERCLGGGEAARGVMPAIADCVDAEVARRDAALNRIYRALAARLGTRERAGGRR